MASWRSGYAADCKALQNHKEINAAPPKRYQDREGTAGERDTPRPTGWGLVSRHALPRHKAAGRLLFGALVADTPATWAQAAQGLALRLTQLELAALAFWALRCLPPADQAEVAAAARRAYDGMPTDPAWRAAWAQACTDHRRSTERRAAA